MLFLTSSLFTFFHFHYHLCYFLFYNVMSSLNFPWKLILHIFKCKTRIHSDYSVNYFLGIRSPFSLSFMRCLFIVGFCQIVLIFIAKIFCWIYPSVCFGSFLVVASYLFSHISSTFHVLEIPPDFIPISCPLHF